MKKNKVRKRIVLFIGTITLMASSPVFACDLNFAESALPNGEAKVMQIDMESIPLSRQQRQAAESFNEGLVAELRENVYSDKITPESLNSKQNCFDGIISDYCKTHYDPISAAVHKAKGTTLVMDLNQKSPAYKKLVEHYKINDKMDITITPEFLYVDEFAETAPEAIGAAADSGTCKKYAARRTLIAKTTINGQTNSWNMYSVHTGGESKYNQSKAVHNSGYYGYARQGISWLPITFKELVKQSESCSGTSWHYKYYGHVSGSITWKGNTFTSRDEPLGCEVVVNKNGTATKNYWPKL